MLEGIKIRRTMLLHILKQARKRLFSAEKELCDIQSQWSSELRGAQENLLEQFRKLWYMDQHGIMIRDDGSYYRMNAEQVQRNNELRLNQQEDPYTIQRMPTAPPNATASTSTGPLEPAIDGICRTIRRHQLQDWPITYDRRHLPYRIFEKHEVRPEQEIDWTLSNDPEEERRNGKPGTQ